MIEAVVVLGLTVVGALIIFLVYRHPIGSPWKVAGADVQDISRAQGIQTEIASALDPTKPRVVFAASNESLEPTIRVYTSTNGGKRWRAGLGPAYDPNTCAWGDPAVAIAPNGREYVAFTEKSICIQGPDLTPYLVVASRPGPTGRWTVRRITRPAVKYGFDDKPAIAVDSGGYAILDGAARIFCGCSAARIRRPCSARRPTVDERGRCHGFWTGSLFSPSSSRSRRELGTPSTLRVSMRPGCGSGARRTGAAILSCTRGRCLCPATSRATASCSASTSSRSKRCAAWARTPRCRWGRGAFSSPTASTAPTSRATSPSPSSTGLCSRCGAGRSRPERRRPTSSGPRPRSTQRPASCGRASTTPPATRRGSTRGSSWN